MKNIIEKFKDSSRTQKMEMFASMILFVVSLGVIILDISGIFKFTTEQLLCLIIALLCNVVFSSMLQEVDSIVNINKSIEKVDGHIKVMEDDVNRLTEKINNSKSTKGIINSRKVLDEKSSLNEIWSGASEVYLLAIANTCFLKGNGIQKVKQQAIDKGTRFKIVSLNPEALAFSEYEKSNIISDTSLPLGENIRAYQKQCKNGTFKNRVELRLTEYMLPFSMMIVKRNDKVSYLKVDLYGVDIDYMNRRSFCVDEEDTENIDFYLEQWNTIWNNNEKTVPIDFAKKY